MFIIGTTRFSDETINENKRWRENNKIKGCIYGTPVIISPTIPNGCNLFVIEMNNNKNKIEGIGLIIKPEYPKKSRPIHNIDNYNRYIYVGEYRIDKEKIEDDYDKRVINVLEQLLFRGARHSKRGQGISQIPKFIEGNKYNYSFSGFFRELFKKEYGEDIFKKCEIMIDNKK